MDISGYVINLMSAAVAVGYMDQGFERKYSGYRRRALFPAACVVYFVTVTFLNWLVPFESVLGFCYGIVLIIYAFLALQGSPQDFLVAGLLWVLIALISTYGVYGIMGIFTERDLDVMLSAEGEMLLYASMAALAVKYSLGKVVSVFFRKQDNLRKEDNWIVAVSFLLLALLAMGLFSLEAGLMGPIGRYWLTVGILADEAGIIAALAGVYHRLGRYQREKLEEQHRQEREKEQRENMLDLYRVGREINHWRHDILASLGVLYRMQKNGKYSEVESYLEKMYGNLRNYPELPQPTGNEGLDAALVKAVPRCRESGIHLSYVVLGKPKGIDCVELGILLDNLLSNGIEACLVSGALKEIDLVLQSHDSGLEIMQENGIGESVLKNNPGLKSSKEEGERHGYGMESIYNTVEKYDGEYEYWEEEQRFCQRIFLNYREEK